jgi:hypothetical protein
VFVEAGTHGSVVNEGSVRAAQIRLEAADGNVYALAGRHASLRATGTSLRDGRVWLVAPRGDVEQHEHVVASNADGTGGSVETTAKTLQLAGTRVDAQSWTIGTDEFAAGPNNAKALAESLSNGTSVTVNVGGSIDMVSSLRWTGDASLALNAGRSVALGPLATISNRGAGSLTLRADAKGIDNHGSVINAGTIDWSRSTGTVAALYDSNGTFEAGNIRTNCDWSPAPFSGLKTQVTAYQLINSIAELENISQSLAGNYALGRDLTASGVFTPIASTSAKGFGGQFDGFGHTLDGLILQGAYDGSRPYLGLFTNIAASGVVRNFSITNAFAATGNSVTGLVAGQSAGLIANVSTNGSLETAEIGQGAIAGVVGVNTGTVARATSDVSMYAQGGMGGIALSNEGLIVQSSAHGDSGGGSHAGVGGIALTNGKAGVIRQSYATGGAGGVTNGGIADENDGLIQQSFTTLAMPNTLPPGYIGGIAWNNTGHITSDVYWDKQLTQQDTGVALGMQIPAANGLTTAQMSARSSFAPSWNFAPHGTWTFVPGVLHPVLQWEVAN